MKSILDTCVPRPDLIAGTFNPEVFTAQLSAVMDHYSNKSSAVSPLYTDPKAFFGEATFPTAGLKQVLTEVFGRIAGDPSLPAIHRLETGFGGGKTHSLIACTHIAKRGKDIAAAVTGLLDAKLLPAPGSVEVVGIAGDEVPVHQPKGKKLVPFTLWGEIALQVGGEKLYRQVEEEANSLGAPGSAFFDAVLGDRKVLIMLDELAQYSARLEAARPGGSQQLAAFLMGLFGYAKKRSGISIIVTLAGSRDAFARQTTLLKDLLSKVRGEQLTDDAALAIAESGINELRSVIARDDNPITPVQPSEISRVLAKRLFNAIEPTAGADAAKAYGQLYARSQSLLPDVAIRPDFADRLAAHYPFHPTFIDFLNKKLATVETFQGTRGVLRVLALAVRNLWSTKLAVPMIHTCHLDLRDPRTVGEILGRTGTADLRAVVDADIGGADTNTLEGGKSNAEVCDLRNPHPEGHPLHEYAWKTVFLHSLVGREQGVGSSVFGINERDCCFEAAFPGLTPPQIQTALKEIENSAFYLRHQDGRFYASLDPSVNIALAQIRRGLTDAELNEVLGRTAGKVIGKDNPPFVVLNNITQPSELPDNKGRPMLALIALDAPAIHPEAFITTCGPGVPRMEQNLVFILAPNTVVAHSPGEQDTFLATADQRAEDARRQVKDLARLVLAMRKLKENPKAYGITSTKLAESDFDTRFRERELALQSTVTQAYNSLWFPSCTGAIARKEIKTAGGEGGASTFELLRKVLLDEGELVTAEHTTADRLGSLASLFFIDGDSISLAHLRSHFTTRRKWPILDAPAVLETLIRAGVERGQWCLYRITSDSDTKPSEMYSRETGAVPYGVDMAAKDWSLVTPAGAKKRGWLGADKPEPEKVRTWVREAATSFSAGTVDDVVSTVTQQHGKMPEADLLDAVAQQVKEGRLFVFSGSKEQKERPANLQTGNQAQFYHPQKGDVLITKKEAAERGWLAEGDKRLSLDGSGPDEVKPLLAALRRVETLYGRGATTTLNTCQLEQLRLPGDARLDMTLTNASPQAMKALGELLSTLARLVEADAKTNVFITVDEPDEACVFLKELKGGTTHGKA